MEKYLKNEEGVNELIMMTNLKKYLWNVNDETCSKTVTNKPIKKVRDKRKQNSIELFYQKRLFGNGRKGYKQKQWR